MAITDVDKTGASYYGEQTLQFISTSGESSMVQLGKIWRVIDTEYILTLSNQCRRWSMIVRMSVFLTDVFDNLCGSHLQRQSEFYHFS